MPSFYYIDNLSSKTLPLINFLNWANASNYRVLVNDTRLSEEVTLFNLYRQLQARLGREPTTDEPILPRDVHGSTTLYLFDGATDDYKNPLLKLVYSSADECWVIVENQLSEFKGIEYFWPYQIHARHRRLALELSDDFINRCNNIDEQYLVYHGINIYKDAEGYFTTGQQLDHKPLDRLAELFNVPTMDTKDKPINWFEMLIEVLRHSGMIYSDEIVKMMSQHITTLRSTKMVKIFDHHYVAKHRFMGPAKVPFIQLPFMLNIIVSSQNTTDSPIEIIDLNTNVSYRIAPEL